MQFDATSCHATCGRSAETHLRLLEYRAIAVEELKRSDELALHQTAGQNCRCCPPPRADGHLPEPCLKRERSLSAHYLIHFCPNMRVAQERFL